MAGFLKIGVVLAVVLALFGRTESRIGITAQGIRRCRPGKVLYNRCLERCICSNNRQLTKCTRIRREFTTMSRKDKIKYVNIVKQAATDPRTKDDFTALIASHFRLFMEGIHTTSQFLPWHRMYLLHYENIIRRIDCTFTVAYWDYIAFSGRPLGTSRRDLWHEKSFGGDGVGWKQCVQTGPFREEVFKLDASTGNSMCLQRYFWLNSHPPDESMLANLLRFNHTQFTDFESALSGDFHEQVHCIIGGTMCSGNAASAPEFVLVHGRVDKIWEEWQSKSEDNRLVYFSELNNLMASSGPKWPGILAKDCLYSSNLPGGVRVEYSDINDKRINIISRKLRRLSKKKLAKIPRVGVTPLSAKAIKVFGVGKDKLQRIRKFEHDSAPMVKIQEGGLSTDLDKDLGFDHTALED